MDNYPKDKYEKRRKEFQSRVKDMLAEKVERNRLAVIGFYSCLDVLLCVIIVIIITLILKYFNL